MGQKMTGFVMKPIGVVRNERVAIADNYWGDVVSVIELDTSILPAEALEGIEQFSHVEIVYVFHKLDPAKINLSARHPRNDPSLPKVGILAQRAKGRVNAIGVSRCQVLSRDG